MIDPTLLLGSAVLVLAGLVKGLVGMGLPTVGIGLLSLVMPPAKAAAILIFPSAVTNIWLYVTGPGVRATALRFATMMVGVAAGTLIGGFALGGLASPLAVPSLGAILALYGMVGLLAVPLHVPLRFEAALSPLMGLLTGIITGLTGVSVLPCAPYLKALGLERDALVQALGLTFTVSTFALAVTLAWPAGDASPLADPRLALASVAALVPAMVGMEAGRRLRLIASPATFTRLFFLGLTALGLYMVGRGIWGLLA